MVILTKYYLHHIVKLLTCKEAESDNLLSSAVNRLFSSSSSRMLMFWSSSSESLTASPNMSCSATIQNDIIEKTEVLSALVYLRFKANVANVNNFPHNLNLIMLHISRPIQGILSFVYINK